MTELLNVSKISNIYPEHIKKQYPSIYDFDAIKYLTTFNKKNKIQKSK